GAVAHEASGHGGVAPWKNRGHRVAQRQSDELFGPAPEEYIGAGYEPAHPELDHGCKRRIEVAFGARVHDMDIKPEVTGGDLVGAGKVAGRTTTGRVGEEPDSGHGGDELAQQFQSLRRDLRIQVAYTSEVAARSIQAGDKSSRDRVPP